MNDSQRKDVESGFLLRNKLNILEERVKPKKINKWSDSSVLCKELGGNWRPSSTGAELKIKEGSVIATATLSKNRATHMYEYGLRLDSSSVGKSSSYETLEDSIKSLSHDLKLVNDLCSRMNDLVRTSDSPTEEQQ